MAQAKTQSDKTRRRMHRDLRDVFTSCGFKAFPSEGIELDIANQKSEFDAVFTYENLVVISEDTADGDTDHLKKKVLFFKHCLSNKDELLRVLRKKLPKFLKGSLYADTDIEIRFIYTSSKTVDAAYRKTYKQDVVFINLRSLGYFLSLARTIRNSARFELFKFLDIKFDSIGTQRSATNTSDYNALILPETPSGFPKGHTLVSFLIDPSTLLRQSYVLRKDGWQDNDSVYQRILMKKKIAKMRQYLVKEGRVFVNNVIATLPDTVEFHSLDGQNKITTFNASNIKNPIRLSIPLSASNIGIIDGQHRVFAYHEGNDSYEAQISKMRGRQHLLVTGIIYPKRLPENERIRFEAKLFLEINDKQTRTNAALKQVIGSIVDPFSEISVAKKVVGNLATTGPLNGILEEHFFDKGKLKTASIVSYGVRHVVKFWGQDSFFKVWRKSGKEALKKGRNKKMLDTYEKYCTDEINMFLSAFKKNIDTNLWTTDKRLSRALTATTITGLIHCMRTLIEKNKRGDFNYYDEAFKKLKGKIDFTPVGFTYKSSHWKDLGDRIFEVCFK